MEECFEITEVSQIEKIRNDKNTLKKILRRNKEKTLWTVKGRAYTNLTLGDILYIFPDIEKPELKNEYKFKIIGIVAFGRNITFINTLFAGELILEGANLEEFWAAKHLYRLYFRTEIN